MTKKPYGLHSDQHLHGWSAFAKTNSEGFNSRLGIILDEMKRAASEVRAAGGNRLYGAGDLFHVRGKVAPSVLNPTSDVVRELADWMELHFIPGNHDLEGRNSNAIGNATHSLGWKGVRIHESSVLIDVGVDQQGVVMIPWIENMDALREEIATIKKDVGVLHVAKYDLIIHAPVNGVLIGVPDSGFDPDELASFGFKRVFAGHYHDHKDFGNGVYSIGATTHQTWSDVDTKAGFLIVHEDRVEYRASNAPQFIDLPPGADLEDIKLLIDGHYVRARIEVKDESMVPELREFLLANGAAGVVIHAIKAEAAVSRTGATVASGVSLEASINEFIKAKAFNDPTEVYKRCATFLIQAREAAE